MRTLSINGLTSSEITIIDSVFSNLQDTTEVVYRGIEFDTLTGGNRTLVLCARTKDSMTHLIHVDYDGRWRFARKSVPKF